MNDPPRLLSGQPASSAACWACAVEVSSNDNFCPTCGAMLRSNSDRIDVTDDQPVGLSMIALRTPDDPPEGRLGIGSTVSRNATPESGANRRWSIAIVAVVAAAVVWIATAGDAPSPEASQPLTAPGAAVPTVPVAPDPSPAVTFEGATVAQPGPEVDRFERTVAAAPRFAGLRLEVLGANELLSIDLGAGSVESVAVPPGFRLGSDAVSSGSVNDDEAFRRADAESFDGTWAFGPSDVASNADLGRKVVVFCPGGRSWVGSTNMVLCLGTSELAVVDLDADRRHTIRFDELFVDGVVRSVDAVEQAQP